MQPPKKMYILTRRDLNAGQGVVQTAHAMAEFMHQHSLDP